MFLFLFDQINESESESESLFPICSPEATYPGHMLIRFWCDSDITFSRGLHKKIGDSAVFLYN